MRRARMNLFLLTLTTGCGDATVGDVAVGDTCPTIKEGYERCAGNSVVVCSEGTWQMFIPCDTNENCIEEESDTARCGNEATKYQPGGTSCAPNGTISCVNSNTIVECVNGVETTMQVCASSCVSNPSGDGFACEGGSQTFRPSTVALTVDGAVEMSLSTLTGNLACGLVDDYTLEPGLASEQLYVILANVGFGCPTGTYGLNSGCDIYYPGTSSARCAIYRRWGSGNHLEAIEALSGAVSIDTAAGGNCAYQIDVVAGGTQMSLAFSVYVGSVSTSAEWCGAY